MPPKKNIKIDLFSRVEASSGLKIEVMDGQVSKLELNIFEPPRFFEGFLEGRMFDEVVDLTARICGICPVSYQMAACTAIESIFGFAPNPQTKRIRRMFSWAEIMQSHLLHVFILQAPDFLGYDSAAEAAKDHPELIKNGLKLKRLANDISVAIGGREVHPVTTRIGGFHSPPPKKIIQQLHSRIYEMLPVVIEAVRTFSGLDIPEFDRDVEFMCLSHPDEYALNEGNIVSTKGINIPMNKFLTKVAEKQFPYSNAMQSFLIDGGTSYMVGPLARININRSRLFSEVKSLIDELSLQFPNSNPYMGIVARILEVYNGLLECYQLTEDSDFYFDNPEYAVLGGEGYGITEAPRGSLFHYYKLDDDGRVLKARLIPPTSQNLFRIENDLKMLIPTWLDLPDKEIAKKSEAAVRNYDPCISCSTHKIKIDIDRVQLF
jgi:coenzyme F420-reducing hydrogenase alpha subunit